MTRYMFNKGLTGKRPAGTCLTGFLGRSAKLVAAGVVVAVGLFSGGVAQAITLDEVVLMIRAGVSEQVILQTINADPQEHSLTPQEVARLRSQGVSDRVIEALGGVVDEDMAAGPETGVTGLVQQERDAGAQAAAEQQAFEDARMAAEVERMRAESARLSAEARRSAPATIRGTARELALGRELLKEKDWFGAAKAFRSFLDSGADPASVEGHEARFGLATALKNAGVYHGAAGELVELLQGGPDLPRFVDGFRMLRELRREIRYSPPVMETFTRFYIGNKPMPVQDEINYFLGEFFYDYNNFHRARAQFEMVSDQSPALQAGGHYLTGLSLVKERKFRSAVELFENAIVASERADKGDQEAIRINHLSYLALARIAFEVGNYDGAIYYYRKLPLSSPKVGDALYESGWTYFMKGDYRNALGVFHAMHSPYMNFRYHPDLLILEATAYMDLCKFADAREAVTLFNDVYAANTVNLKQFIGNYPTPDSLYNGFVESANAEDQAFAELPQVFVEAVLGNIEFYELYRTVRALDRELDALAIEGARLDEFGVSLRNTAQSQRDRYVIELGIKIQQILSGVDRELNEWQIKATEVTYEIDRGEKDVLDAQIKAAYRGETIPEKTSQVRTAGRVLVGDQIQIWPYQGEFWQDELVFYRGILTQECDQ